MGEREDEQALKLNETMDEFSSTVNQCLSQLTVEMQKVEQSRGASVTQLRVALDKKQRLRLPTDENQCLKAELGRLEARLALACEEKEMLDVGGCEDTVPVSCQRVTREARAGSGGLSEGDDEEYRAERADQAEAGDHQDPGGDG
eukprot:961535-Amphidinium_carterae.4